LWKTQEDWDKEKEIMTSLQTLESIGYRLDALKLANPDHQGRSFTYYTFVGKVRPKFQDVYEIVGIHLQRRDPLLFEMRFLHLEEEMYEWEEFQALEDAPFYLSLDPAKELALFQFLKHLDPIHLEMEEVSIKHFHRMSSDDLRSIRLPEWKIPYLQGRIYRYPPNPGIQPQEEISVFSFPHWASHYGANQVTTLACNTFLEEQLLDPQFEPLGSFGSTFGTGTVTFDLVALREFVCLLKQHAYNPAGL
jgi:hypothetical protein